jgi:hypothetical protein
MTTAIFFAICALWGSSIVGFALVVSHLNALRVDLAHRAIVPPAGGWDDHAVHLELTKTYEAPQLAKLNDWPAPDPADWKGNG